MITIVRMVRTCDASPSQWDGWDAAGTYYYFRYEDGLTIDRAESEVAHRTLLQNHEWYPRNDADREQVSKMELDMCQATYEELREMVAGVLVLPAEEEVGR